MESGGGYPASSDSSLTGINVGWMDVGPVQNPVGEAIRWFSRKGMRREDACSISSSMSDKCPSRSKQNCLRSIIELRHVPTRVQYRHVLRKNATTFLLVLFEVCVVVQRDGEDQLRPSRIECESEVS